MLVLTRCVGESILCQLPDGQELIFTIARNDPGRVRVGIQAPRSVNILRTELLDRIPLSSSPAEPSMEKATA